MLKSNGMNVIYIGHCQNKSKRIIENDDPVRKVIHSLASCNDLRLEESNHLKFRETKMGLTITVVE